ncbi:hypothetical protein PMAYCL1PPCAC_17350, partial [Pristionchus mayeri]
LASKFLARLISSIPAMDHQHLLQSLWRRQHSLTAAGSSFGSTESSIDSTSSAYSSSSSTTTTSQLPILQEEDPCTMELSPGAGTSSANGTPSPPFCFFPNGLLNGTQGLASSPLLPSDSSYSSSMITPPPSYQTALLSTLKVPDLDKLAELAALLNNAAMTSAAASLLASVPLIPPPLPTTLPPRDDLMPLDLSNKSSHPSALLAPSHLLQPQFSSGCSSSAQTAAAMRPSVILDGSNLRRSASSITASSRPVPDVNEHFRRSLSGKWPRRVPSLEDRRTPFRRPPSGQSAASRSSPAPSCNNNNTIVITTNSNETIEDYFRRALGVEEFEEWKRSREEIEDRKRRQREE